MGVDGVEALLCLWGLSEAGRAEENVQPNPLTAKISAR
jgi:hypothetical protein